LSQGWVTKVKGQIRPYTSAAKEKSKRIFLNALLTAVIVFCAAIATAITAGPAQLGLLTFVCAALSATIAFCQSLLDVWRLKH